MVDSGQEKEFEVDRPVGQVCHTVIAMPAYGRIESNYFIVD